MPAGERNIFELISIDEPDPAQTRRMYAYVFNSCVWIVCNLYSKEGFRAKLNGT